MSTDASTPDDPRGAAGRTVKRIDFDTRVAILRLRTAHPERSARQIAADVGCSAMSVGRILATSVDTKALTQALMRTDITPALEEWSAARTISALKGDHRPSRDWLLAAGAIEDASAKPQLAVGFNVLIAPSPGTPAYVNASAPSVVSETPAQALTLATPSSDAMRTPAEHTPVSAPDAAASASAELLSTAPPWCAASERPNAHASASASALRSTPQRQRTRVRR